MSAVVVDVNMNTISQRRILLSVYFYYAPGGPTMTAATQNA